MSAQGGAPGTGIPGTRENINGSSKNVARRKPVLRVLRSLSSAKASAPKERCRACLGRRIILLDTWPHIRYGRCPSCNGTDPTTGTTQRKQVSYTLLDGRMEAA